jgi:hypothetical protein
MKDMPVDEFKEQINKCIEENINTKIDILEKLLT